MTQEQATSAVPGNRIAIVGTGFVADLYLRSLRTLPQLAVVGAYDHDADRLAKFCRHWNVPAAKSLSELLVDGPRAADLILNLTNPNAHYDVTRQCLESGRHVYSEKPLAMSLAEAEALCELARQRQLIVTSAPCSFLGQAAQTIGWGLRQGMIGRPRLVYAELDDDFIPQAPYGKWLSESGAPWPYRDEFMVGCTLEHAGYYLSWLVSYFGTIRKVVAASACVIDNKLPDGTVTAPDFSVATLFFDNGVTARLTCSIVAPHDHRLRIIGDDGVLELDECWNNRATVRCRRRYVLRRRLMNSPFSRKVRLPGPTHPHVGRRGAASMNFALGPLEVLTALQERRPTRMSAELALHITEVTLAIQNARDHTGVQVMTSQCPPVEPMPWAMS